VWEAVKSQAAFFADARMAAEVVRVLASDRPATDAYYSTTLFDSGQAYAGACTAKSTIYTASIAAGLMVSQFTRWLRGLPVERDLLLNLLAAELTGT
jgi:sulfur carrier protein ThiS adenylyltransferase